MGTYGDTGVKVNKNIPKTRNFFNLKHTFSVSQKTYPYTLNKCFLKIMGCSFWEGGKGTWGCSLTR